MPPRRIERINDLLREVIAEVVARELKDPRLEGSLISITEVRAAANLQRARVLVSVMGSEEQAEEALAALTRSSAFVWRTIRPRLNLRTVPELRFELDDRIAQDRHFQDLLNDLEGAPGASEDDAS